MAADDKDFDPCWNRMCALASNKIMGHCADQDGQACPYDAADMEKMEEAFEELKDDWLDEVFGVDSKLDSENWMKKIVAKESIWIFEPEALRKKILEKADLPFRY